MGGRSDRRSEGRFETPNEPLEALRFWQVLRHFNEPFQLDLTKIRTINNQKKLTLFFCRSYIFFFEILITKGSTGPPLNPLVPFLRNIQESIGFILILWKVNLVIMNLTYQIICSSKNNHFFFIEDLQVKLNKQSTTTVYFFIPSTIFLN